MRLPDWVTPGSSPAKDYRKSGLGPAGAVFGEFFALVPLIPAAAKAGA